MELNPDDYIKLNPDLCLKDNNDAVKHWEESGKSEMRLCNLRQLFVVSELGAEILQFACYYYYLNTHGLFSKSVRIQTYQGMSCFYYFLDPSQIEERNEERNWIPPESRPFLVNKTEHVKNFVKPYWTPVPYKEYYKNNEFVFEKPILVVQNKFNIEWNKGPINYFDTEMLDSIFKTLKDRYQIIYTRPRNNISLEQYGYSKDHNTMLEELDDYEFINQHYKDDIILFDDLLNKSNSYNVLKLKIFANCDSFISVQGGSSHLAAFFYKRLIVLHRRGYELNSGAYQGWYLECNQESDKTLRIISNHQELVNSLDIF